MITELYRKYVLEISFIGLIFGSIFLALSTVGVFLENYDFVKDSAFLKGFLDTLGNYKYWLFIIALCVTIACGWIFGDLILKLKKFNSLIKTESKATFVRNQNELEELAWKLGPKYSKILNKRKRKFRIRK